MERCRKLLRAGGWLDIATALLCAAASAAMVVLLCMDVWRDARESEAFGAAAVVAVPALFLFFAFPTCLFLAYAACGARSLRLARGQCPSARIRGVFAVTAGAFVAAGLYQFLCGSLLLSLGQPVLFAVDMAGMAAFAASLAVKGTAYARARRAEAG